MLALCVSDTSGPPIPSREAPDRRKHRPPATHTPQEVNLAIALARHTRQSAANHCTAARASTKCSCPSLVLSKIRTVCELRRSSTACKSATRSRHAVGRHNMRARTPTDPEAYPRHRASTASAMSASSRSLSIVAAGVSWLLLSCARRRRTAFFSGPIFSHGVFNGDRDSPCCGPRCASASCAMQCRGTARAFARGLLILSEKQTAPRANAYLAVQRISAQVQL